MRIAIAADHNGLALKARLIDRLTAAGHEVDDRGGFGAADDVIDYPPLCADVCDRVVDGRADRAIVVGGSGQGEHIACNKIRGVRAGLCHDRFTTEISRAHNDSNVLVIVASPLVVQRRRRRPLLNGWQGIPRHAPAQCRRSGR
jgi:ribose 5-phosphate isomerase B